MPRKAKSAVVNRRAGTERDDIERVEVTVRKEDAGLVRAVASTLSDPLREADARLLLRERFVEPPKVSVEPPKVSLKALLASAPLDRIDLGRSQN